MNADHDKSEQPCTDTRCDAQTHPADDAVRITIPPIPRPCRGCGVTEAEQHIDDCPEVVRAYERAVDPPSARARENYNHSTRRAMLGREWDELTAEEQSGWLLRATQTLPPSGHS